MDIELTGDEQGQVDDFMEDQLLQSLFMADDPSRWLYGVDSCNSDRGLIITDIVTGNKLNFATSLAGSAVKTKMTQIG